MIGFSGCGCESHSSMGMKLAKERFCGSRGKYDSVGTLRSRSGVQQIAWRRRKEEQDEETQQDSLEGFGNGVHFRYSGSRVWIKLILYIGLNFFLYKISLCNFLRNLYMQQDVPIVDGFPCRRWRGPLCLGFSGRAGVEASYGWIPFLVSFCFPTNLPWIHGRTKTHKGED